ncbi:GTP/GDP 3'-pyrophosphokinase and (p)ppGpp 3'-pyrophosphohydrolase [Syntrophotalea carbinolica DSM 2380]|uniref:GTP/GDP 3'-pyrophosphokinase and (P)ppGpp 3'-pyrophosphohydrolase n=1 Tax=Syntrophotalea carbinolica (strain DSM 2380 / NBRC 103641 / GraBd1) TaxID=338963 RepID=Q3A5P3_SYNC1|nr:HD domain-containing protein [Syntrophotalea carbinolica]ABA88314.1 GTP/GDP 3'-pyrophosphokinase and (p)ppGpp 3'-pyrophosphohydrolase [Syntrophotalea carbinolica DSM 2380]
MAETSNKERRMVNDILELLVTHYGGGLSEEELDAGIGDFNHAIAIASKAHEGQFRKSGEPFFIHPLRVAHEAARHWMDFASVVSALLHDVVEDTPMTLAEVETAFGPEVARLVNGLTKVSSEELSREVLKTQTYRKQLLLAIEDVRVLCLKFWDRMDNLKTISALNPGKQALIAKETRAVYVPLARHLGMGHVASHMEALSLNILYPGRANRYRRVVQALRTQVEPQLRQIRANFRQAFEHYRLATTMKDRWRPFSIDATRCMGRGISSLYTLEIQVARTMDAYLALGIVHELYNAIPGKLRDHLTIPSPFGYQALKTTVQAGQVRLRVEITTHKLARFNESGVLTPGFEFRKENFQELMESLLEGEAAFDTESLRLAASTIQVYTPKGEIRTLPAGSSALDFAFAIHEKVGLFAWRARINGQTRQLKSRLMDGDQVEIERGMNPTVLPKWLEWAVTPRAHNHIRRYLRTRVKDGGA